MRELRQKTERNIKVSGNEAFVKTLKKHTYNTLGLNTRDKVKCIDFAD